MAFTSWVLSYGVDYSYGICTAWEMFHALKQMRLFSENSTRAQGFRSSNQSICIVCSTNMLATPSEYYLLHTVYFLVVVESNDPIGDG
jgi:hypothetical protein